MRSAPILLILSTILLICGCAGSSSPSPTNPNLTYASELTSESTALYSLNGGNVAAGWNKLVGTTTLNSGQEASVEMLGNVAYRDGNGPFFGFLTIKLNDGSLLTAQMDGTAIKTGTVTKFTCQLTILGGTGTYNNATGGGYFNGNRDSALGGTVHIDTKLRVDR
jgi:hypothetical protein